MEYIDLDSMIVGVAQGSTEALSQLYREASPAVYAYALSVLKNNHDAEDVLHDCFVSIATSAGSYRTKGKPMAWILTIAKNLCLKHLRQQSKTTEWNPDIWNDGMDMNFSMTTDDRVVIRECMERLSDEERQIVVLHAVAGFKHREIASLLGLTLSTVLSKYHRAIKKLKANL